MPRNRKIVGGPGEKRGILDDPFYLGIPSWFALPEFLATKTIRETDHASTIGFIRPLDMEGDGRITATAADYKARNPHEPHVYVGFGSMNSNGALRRLSIIADAARALGIRLWMPDSAVNGLVASRAKVDHIHALPPTPHRQIFPLVDAVLCHGGIGTIVSALDCNRSVGIVPHWFDQFHWAKKLVQQRLAVAEYTIAKQRHAVRLLDSTLRFEPDESLVKCCQDNSSLDRLQTDVEGVVT